VERAGLRGMGTVGVRHGLLAAGKVDNLEPPHGQSHVAWIQTPPSSGPRWSRHWFIFSKNPRSTARAAAPIDFSHDAAHKKTYTILTLTNP